MSVYTLFFRSFYMLFIGLFVMMLLAVSLVTYSVAAIGDPAATTAGLTLVTCCLALIDRAVAFMRE